MGFEDMIGDVGKAVDVLGVAVLVLGVVWGLGVLVLGRSDGDVYKHSRHTMGKGILLGLEILVAADIIRTVAVSPTFTSVGVLAVIVLIRTFLSMALQLEIDGVLPWRKGTARTSNGGG